MSHTIVEQYVHNGYFSLFFFSYFLFDTPPREHSPWTETESCWVKVIPFRRRDTSRSLRWTPLRSCRGIRYRTGSIIDWSVCLH